MLGSTLLMCDPERVIVVRYSFSTAAVIARYQMKRCESCLWIGIHDGDPDGKKPAGREALELGIR